ELAVLDLLHTGLVPGVAALREGELSQRGVEILHLREARVDVLAARLASALLDGLRQDDHAGVGLGGELVRIDAGFLHRGEEFLVGGILAERVPGGAHRDALGSGAGVLDERGAVEAIAAEDRARPAALPRLRD